MGKTSRQFEQTISNLGQAKYVPEEYFLVKLVKLISSIDVDFVYDQ